MSISRKLLEDAIEVNKRLRGSNGGKPFAKTQGSGNKNPEVTRRSMQIVEMWNDGLRVYEIHKKIGISQKQIKDILQRYRGELTDRSGNYYDIKDLSGQDYDRVMRCLEACKRSVSREEVEKIERLQTFLRKFPRQYRFMD